MRSKLAIRAFTVLLVLCGAALVALLLRPARIENRPQTPVASAPSRNFGQFTALARPLPAPALSFTTRTGIPKRLADFRGGPVLVNLWATWCAPCLKEMPSLERLQARLGDKLTILAISEDGLGEKAVAPFLEKHHIAHLAIFLDPKTAAIRAFGAEGLPTSYLISPEGRILGKEEGGAIWDSAAMLAKLKPYIAAK